MAQRLLIVEDEASIAEPLIEGLEREGFAVVWVTTGAEGLARAGAADAVLLDLGLPDLDGKEVCRRLRATSTVPIVVITARGDEIDRVVLLELGADDYLVKPFGFRELVARIGAVTRRADQALEAARALQAAGVAAAGLAAPATGAAPVDATVQHVGRLGIDRDARRVVLDGDEVDLTPKEFDLLAFLAERPGAVRTREDIVEQVWDEHWFGPTKTLDVHVAALRRKLGADWITTFRGVGYRLETLG